MKPQEETWHMFDADPPGLAIEGDRIADFAGPDGGERAKLAAQAPALARSLLQLLDWVVFFRCREHGSDPNKFEEIKAARVALYYAGVTDPG